MKRIICFLLGHKYREKGENAIFISSLCMRCWSNSMMVKNKQKIYFSDGVGKITSWNKK